MGGPLREGDVLGETVAVIVPMFGDEEKWKLLAQRALHSARFNSIAPYEGGMFWGSTLAEARNKGAQTCCSDWLIFLDADDELDFHYIEEMLKGEGDIRQPSTLGVVDGVEDDYPVLIPPHAGGMLAGNHLVIGCMVRRELFLMAGGFRELPILEDWDLWIRCVLEGAVVSTCPEAIYRVHVNPNSRNQQNLHGNVYSQIQQEYQTNWYARGLR